MRQANAFASVKTCICAIPTLLCLSHHDSTWEQRWQHHCYRHNNLDLAKTVRHKVFVAFCIAKQSWYDSVYCRVALATRLLRGLKCYHITAAGADTSKLVSQSTNILTQRPTKQQAAKAKKRDADLGEAGTVTSMPASPTQIEATKFYSQLDTLVRSAHVPAVHQAKHSSLHTTFNHHMSAVDVPGGGSTS